MSDPQDRPDWRQQLARRLRVTLAELKSVMPVAGAAALARKDPDGPLQTVAEEFLEEHRDRPSPRLALSDAALAWVEANRCELVMEMRRGYVRGELYRPLIEHRIPAAVVCPLMFMEDVSGVIIFTTHRRTCTTGRQLKLLRVLTPKVAEFVPPPMSAQWEAEASAPADRSASRADEAEAIEEEHSLRAELMPDPAVESTRAESAPTAERATPGPASEPTERKAPPGPTAVESHAPAEEFDIRLEADPLGRVEAWSDRAEHAFGWTRDEVIGSFLTLFWRDRHRHLLDPALRDELLKEGGFDGRALCYSRDGLPVTCRMLLRERRDADGRTLGFTGAFRIIKPRTLLPREDIEFGFARLYAFTNPVKP